MTLSPPPPHQPLYDVGFLGRGFVELPSHILKRDSNFGFTFQTMESDALLMVSTFIGQVSVLFICYLMLWSVVILPIDYLMEVGGEPQPTSFSDIL